MKKTIFIIALILSIVQLNGRAADLDQATQQKVISKVEAYCNLIQQISGDVEKIDKQDALLTMCENPNVSVFNDLVPANKDISMNSIPLQQYMMQITEKFDNNVKTSFSGFKYVKTVVQPSGIEGFPAARYAFVKVDKKVDAKGFKATNHFNILVNLDNLKISSTISEDYEDPQSIYLNGLEMFNYMEYKKAANLFEKVSNLERYPGRNRAKAMLGWCLVEQKKYQEAYDNLRASWESGDPVGGVILSSKMLMSDNVPINFRNSTEGINILMTCGEKRDKDTPTMHLIAKNALLDAIIDFRTFSFKYEPKDMSDVWKLADDILNDTLSAATPVFKITAYDTKACEYSFKGSPTKDRTLLMQGLAYVQKADSLLWRTPQDSKAFQKSYINTSFLKANLYSLLGMQSLATSEFSVLADKPYAALTLAMLFTQSDKAFPQALTYFEKAANNGDALGAYIMSISAFPWHFQSTSMPPTEFFFLRELVRSSLTLNWKNFLWYLVKANVPKSDEEWLKWNKKAQELGSAEAMEDYAAMEAAGDGHIKTRNIRHAIELACKAEQVGQRSSAEKFLMVYGFSLNPEERDKQFEETERFKIAKELADKGDPAAAYLLFEEYGSRYEESKNIQDSLLAVKYVKQGCDKGFFFALYDYAASLVNNGKELDKAYDIFTQLTALPSSQAYSKLGVIERKYRHNNAKAFEYYNQGKKRNEYESEFELADMYMKGDGCARDLNAAKECIQKSFDDYVATCRPIDDLTNVDTTDVLNQELRNIMRKRDEINRLIASGDVQSQPEYINQLNALLANTSTEGKIALSDKLLKSVFASPQAVVKTVAANGTTIVSTETAEDFMLRISTSANANHLSEVSSKKDGNGKLLELVVNLNN